MKILLVCAGGMSTSILMKKMEKYWASVNIPLEISAVGLADYQDSAVGCDVVLVGPQVSYRLKEIQGNVPCPCDSIAPTDYALGNCQNILALVNKLTKK